MSVDEISNDVPTCDVDGCTQDAILCLDGLYYCEEHGISFCEGHGITIEMFGTGNEVVGPLD